VVIFTSFSNKIEVLKSARKLAGSKCRLDESFSAETRRIKRELIPTDENKFVHITSLRKDILTLK
jgi:hypothetical protein